MKRNRVTLVALTGRILGRAIIAMVDLMYQNNTAKNFLKSLTEVLNNERLRREFKIKK